MKENARPNIVLINCDDLGYGDLGCYGSSVNKTPNIDELATEGRRFSSFYMASPVCSPSRGAMLTGCYPRRVGFGSFDGQWVLFPGMPIGLDPSEVTISSMLKKNGYSTAIVGKWHCGDQKEFLPDQHGFDDYFGLPYSNDMGRQRKADPSFPPLPLMHGSEVLEEQPDQCTLTERYTEFALRFIRRNRDIPFFLYFAHMHVHLPHYVPDRLLTNSKNGRYGAAVANIDWSTGVLMNELKALGLEENTIVIFTSDNGSRASGEGGSNGGLSGIKGSTWEGGQRVPCIVRWPGHIQPNSECDELTTAMDFLPTIASLIGDSLPEDRIIDGYDVSSLWIEGEDLKSPYEAFYYYFMDDLEAVRAGCWKRHIRRNGEDVNLLFDLDADPAEQLNLYYDRPEVVAMTDQLIENARQELGDAATGYAGKDLRPAGRVSDGKTLTEYSENHPYMVAMYDLEERG
ncbi:MAG: sulfatase [Puniceicoccaceae bacterium]